MELVLMTFQVAKLSELLVASVQLACKRLGRGVNNLVSPHIAPLCKGLTADVTAVWTLSSMPSLVCLEVSKLRKSLATSRLLTHLG